MIDVHGGAIVAGSGFVEMPARVWRDESGANQSGQYHLVQTSINGVTQSQLAHDFQEAGRPGRPGPVAIEDCRDRVPEAWLSKRAQLKGGGQRMNSSRSLSARSILSLCPRLGHSADFS